MDAGGDATAADAGRWWGAAPQASADVMNQLCRVCGEPAAGFHFGAFTCEGCKSFFGRTYNNLGSISECKNNGECVINKKNRTSCKACRLRKCLLVGMSKSGSRYGRRSNWFKIHCLLQEQQQQQQQQQQQSHLHQQQGGRQQRSPPHPSALGMLGHHHQAQQGGHPHFDPRLHHQLAAAMSHHHHQRAKEDLMLLGLDEYKNSTSPSISSPESHNSDSSVEVSDQRLASRTAGLFKESAAAGRDGLLVPLPFATLASLAPSVFPHAAAAAAAAFLQPSAFAGAGAAGAPFLFPAHGGYAYPPAQHKPQHGHHAGAPKLPATHAANFNNNTIDAAAGKRFFLDAILQSQRVSPPTTPPRGAAGSDVDADDDGNEAEDDASSSHHSPSLLLSDQEQENPMDLSMKGCRIRAEERRSTSPGGYGDGSAADGADEDDEADADGDGEGDGHRSDSGLSHGCGADVDDAQGHAALPHRATPIDLTTKA